MAGLWRYIRVSYQGTGHGRRLAHLGNRRFRDRMDLGGFTYRRSLGDRILRMGVIGLPLAAGAGGVFVIELPYLITRVLTPRIHYIWSVRDLVWPSLAFGAGAFAGCVYRMLLSRALERN